MGPAFNLSLLGLSLRAKAGARVGRSPGQSPRKYPTLLIAAAARTVRPRKQSMKSDLVWPLDYLRLMS